MLPYLLSVLLCTAAICDAGERPVFSAKTPEEALSYYINALRAGDVEMIYAVYYSDREDFKFHLDRPIKIDGFEVVSKRAYNKKITAEYKASPKAHVGDVELELSRTLSGRKEMFTYLFRKIGDNWYLISHSAWNQP